MNRMLSCTSALALVFAATGAMADVTPEEVWESWQALSTSAGQTLTVGGTARNGDTLEVSGLVVTFNDDLGGSFTANIDKMAFKDNGDGTVSVTMADSYPMSLAFPPDADGPASVKLTVMQPGLAVKAAGSAADTSYEFTAPVVSVKLDEIVSREGQVMDMHGDLVMSELSASYQVARDGDATKLDSSLAVKAVALNFSGIGANGAQGVVTFTMTDLTGKTAGNFLGAEIMANMAVALNSGFTADSSFAFGAMAFSADIQDPSGPVKLTTTAQGGDFVLAVNRDRVNYGTALRGASFIASSPDIPFPEVTVSFAETAFNVLLPVSKSDSPQDFILTTRLVDIVTAEEVWAMIDPSGTLSREPVTAIFDVKGTGFWKQDIMDPNAQLDGAEPPGELTSLDITEIRAKAAGAEVSATGGLTFDNTDLVSFQGVPAPTGSIEITIKGANALIDNLIAMGLVSQDDAMGARMMMAMFARPGAGPDELSSLIEFKDGGLFANGQQLQ